MDPVMIIMILAALYCFVAAVSFIILWATSKWWLKPLGRLIDYSLRLIKLILDPYFRLLDFLVDSIIAAWRFYQRFMDGLAYLTSELVREVAEIFRFYLQLIARIWGQSFRLVREMRQDLSTIKTRLAPSSRPIFSEGETPPSAESASVPNIKEEKIANSGSLKRKGVKVVSWLLFFLGDVLFAWGISNIAFHQVLEGIALIVIGMALMVPIVLPLALSSVHGRRKRKWRIAAPLFWFLAAVCLWIGITNISWSLYAAIGIAAFSLLAMIGMVIVQLHPE